MSLSDSLEKLNVKYQERNQFEKNEKLESAVEIIAGYFDDCPPDFQNAITDILKAGLGLGDDNGTQ